jgi:hypothetical protein
MGSQDNKGIIPRLCDSLFDLIAKQQSSELTYKVEVSYMEIYNEKVRFDSVLFLIKSEVFVMTNFIDIFLGDLPCHSPPPLLLLLSSSSSSQS